MPVFISLGSIDFDRNEVNSSTPGYRHVPDDLDKLSQFLKSADLVNGTTLMLTVTTRTIEAIRNVKPRHLRVIPLSVEFIRDLDLTPIIGRWSPLKVTGNSRRLAAKDPLILYIALLDACEEMPKSAELDAMTDFVRGYLPSVPASSWRRWPPPSDVFDSMVNRSLEILTKTFSTVGYERCCVCFNGGKDSTVAFDQAMSASRFLNWQRSPKVLLLITDDEFIEVLDFVREVTREYRAELIEIRAPTIKQALKALRLYHGQILACVMGTRRSDPGCEQMQEIAPTDPGWPALLRINPIVDWSYNTVWEYIKRRKLRYCALYDQGYTSIGPKSRTRKNPELLVNGKYLEAAELRDLETERKGRT